VIVPKLSAAYFAIRMVKHFMSFGIPKLIYYENFHSIMNYGIILGGNSSYNNTIFKLQKRIITIVLGARARDSSREYFKELNILPLQPQYTLKPVHFVIHNKNQFAANFEIPSITLETNLIFISH
jgi:hypothetical protein